MKQYLGSQISLHFPGNSIRHYHTDTSGEVLYKFNDFGFRTTGLEIQATRTIWVVGCSLTFGTGLRVEDTWANRLAGLIGMVTGRTASLWNFSQGGASNDFILRTIWDQIQTGKPDLIIIQITYPDRTEYTNDIIQGGMIGRWNRKRVSSHYFSFYNDQIGYSNLARNILLLKLVFEKYGVKFLISPVTMPSLSLEGQILSEIPRRYFETIDADEFLKCDLWDKSGFHDLASDGLHPGPISNLLYAQKIMSHLESRRLLG